MQIVEMLKDVTYSKHKYFRVYLFLVSVESKLDYARWIAKRKIQSMKSKLNAKNPFRKTLWNLSKKWYQRWGGM